MNKKLNTFFFLIVGTIVNILVMLLLLISFFYLIRSLFTPETNDSVFKAVTLSAVMLSVFGSYLIYSKIVKFMNKKWDLERWIEPLFNKKK